ncbi:MAG: ATP-binding cassette domain-containing protein [Acidimicrobiales bacterium]
MGLSILRHECDVYEGEALALLRTDGAGKSTLLKVIAGLEKTTGGTVSYFGAAITDVPAERFVTEQLLLVVGGRAVFGDKTVDENLEMQAGNRPAGSVSSASTSESGLRNVRVDSRRVHCPVTAMSRVS